MIKFQEWAEENVSEIFEMANFFGKEMGGSDTWALQNVQVQGPSIHSILKSKSGGMTIDELANALVARSKFRKKGSDHPFAGLSELAKVNKMDAEEIKRGYLSALKKQLRSQKSKVWKDRVAVMPGNKWTLTKKSDEPMRKGGKPKQPSSLLKFKDEEKKED